MCSRGQPAVWMLVLTVGERAVFGWLPGGGPVVFAVVL
jgi:hypothetical protein